VRTRLVTLPVAALCATLLLASPAGAATAVLQATLTAAAVPTGGDPAGSGEAYVVADTATGRVCTVVIVRGVAQIFAAHIHKGATGVQGPHAIDLNTPVDYGTGIAYSVTCTMESPALIADLIANPSGYYVNVHSFARPQGAVRGQLTTLTPGAGA
jgi:hypothetical protein